MSQAHSANTAVNAVASATTPATVLPSIEHTYKRLYPSLVRLAYLLVDTTEHAEEVVQDAFAKAYPKWSGIDDHDAYMRTVVINGCRRVQRRRMLFRRTPQHAADDAVLGADHIADAVRRLPLTLRQIVVLRYYLQLSVTEIAHTLRLAPGTVKSSLHRARGILRKELE